MTCEPGDILGGKFRLDHMIGSGAMGIVFAATDLSLGRRVAVKVMTDEVANDEVLHRRFEREARAAASLKSPHAVQIYDVGTEDDTRYLVMEYLEGRPLDAMLEEFGPTSIPTVVGWMLQALDAIAEGHALGLVHRDIKPGNLFLASRSGADPVVKVLDFGLVKSADLTLTKLTETGNPMGTPAYMAPEQIRAASDLDARADVWSIGVTFFELLTGDLPFEGTTIADLISRVLEDPPLPVRARRRDVPERIEAIIARCLAKTRDERFASASDVAEALRLATGIVAADAPRLPPIRAPGAADALATTLIAPPRASPPSPPSPPLPRPPRSGLRPGVFLGGLLSVFVSGGLLLVLFLPRPPVATGPLLPAVLPDANADQRIAEAPAAGSATAPATNETLDASTANVLDPAATPSAPGPSRLATKPKSRGRTIMTDLRGFDAARTGRWSARTRAQFDSCARPTIPCESGIVHVFADGSTTFRRTGGRKTACDPNDAGWRCVARVLRESAMPLACVTDWTLRCEAEFHLDFE